VEGKLGTGRRLAGTLQAVVVAGWAGYMFVFFLWFGLVFFFGFQNFKKERKKKT
jgi:hypothetical protein